MTNNEAVEILKGDFSRITLNEKESHSDVFTKAFNMAIEALQEVQHYKDDEEQGGMTEQKHGTWTPLDTYVYEDDGMWQCSECKEDFYFEFGTPLDCRAYYCPNCGAKMELKELE